MAARAVGGTGAPGRTGADPVTGRFGVAGPAGRAAPPGRAGGGTTGRGCGPESVRAPGTARAPVSPVGAGCEPGKEGWPTGRRAGVDGTAGRAGPCPPGRSGSGRAGGGGTVGGCCRAVEVDPPREDREPVSRPAAWVRRSGSACRPGASTAAAVRKEVADNAFGKPTGGEGGAGSSAGRGRKISP
ncbi:hypothetical protein Acsp07_24250 [Actinomycetospora sp. NBRC 106378]|nr:hypothetical protein Acsp07_24250 [Actinomycetospora sp. NBRC 106378]